MWVGGGISSDIKIMVLLSVPCFLIPPPLLPPLPFPHSLQEQKCDMGKCARWFFKFLITTAPWQIIQDSLNCPPPPPHFHSEKKKKEQQTKSLSFDVRNNENVRDGENVFT
jgi:hypothetical protein